MKKKKKEKVCEFLIHSDYTEADLEGSPEAGERQGQEAGDLPHSEVTIPTTHRGEATADRYCIF